LCYELSLKGLISLAGASPALGGRLLLLAGPGKVSSWPGWVVSMAAVLPPVVAPCGALLLVLKLLHPCAVSGGLP
jgi:hypothetical protein